MVSDESCAVTSPSVFTESIVQKWMVSRASPRACPVIVICVGMAFVWWGICAVSAISQSTSPRSLMAMSLSGCEAKYSRSMRRPSRR